MGLKHIVFASSKVEFAGGDFTVRGLSLSDITFLVQAQRGSLDRLFNSILEKVTKPADDPAGQFNLEEVDLHINTLLAKFPEVGAQIIACGSDELSPEGLAIAAQLPLPVQVDALDKILALTFQAEGGPKKLLETVIRMAQGTNGLLAGLVSQENIEALKR